MTIVWTKLTSTRIAMAVFVRPATWSYDLPLFRAAASDEDELEAMLAAIALPRQGLWVVESRQQPVAFAWIEIHDDTLRLRRLHVATDQPASQLLPPLFERIEEEYADAAPRLEIADASIVGADAAALQAVGIRRRGEVWVK